MVDSEHYRKEEPLGDLPLRKQIQELKRENELLKQILDQVPLGIQVFDSNGLSHLMNNKQKELLGLESKYVGVGSFNVLKDPFSVSQGAVDYYKKAYAGQKVTRSYEYDLSDASNRWKTRKERKWFEEELIPLEPQKKQFPFVVSILRDATEEKHQRDLLEESEGRFQAFFVQDRCVKLIIDPDTGNIEDANPSAEEFYGLPREELINKNINEINILSKSEIEYEMSKAVSMHSMYFNFKHKTASGIIRDVEVYSSPLMINEKKKLFSIIHDITEKKKAEEDLKKSEERHKNFIRHSKDIFYKYSGKHGFIFWSDPVKDLFGYSKEELQNVPKLWLDSIHPNDIESVRDALDRVIDTGYYEMRYRIKNRAGTWIWLYDYSIGVERKGDDFIVDGHARDITQQKLLEQKLEEATKRYDLAIDAAKDGVWDWNLRTNEIFYSPNWKKMLGYEDHELPNVFAVWEELTHPNDVEQAFKRLDKHINGELNRFEMEMKMRHKKGHWVDILSRAVAYKDEHATPYRMVGTHIDISQQKKTEKELSEAKKVAERAMEKAEQSELSLKQAHSLARVGGWEFDVETSMFLFNDNFYEIFNASVLDIGTFEMTSEEYAERFIYPEDRAVIGTAIEKALKTNDPDFSDYLEHRILFNDGSTGHIGVKYFVIKDEDGNTTKLFGVNQDITEQKERERRVEESRIKFETIFSMSDVGMTITDEEGNIIDCNPASEGMLGITKDEHLARNYAGKEWKIIRTDGSEMPIEEYASVRSMTENSIVADIEMGVVKKENDIIWLSVTATPLNLAGYGVLVAYVDISNRIEYEQKLEEANATKDKFFSIIAHDLRSPFTGIQGLTELASLSLKRGELEKVQSFCGLIKESTLEGTNLLNNLLHWSRVESNRIEYKPENVNLSEHIRRQSHLYSGNLSKKRILLDMILEDNIFVLADLFMLETILRNLISNAIKFSPEQGVITISSNSKGRNAQVVVEDNGIGISKNHLAKLFNLKDSFSTSGTLGEKGTGLGLILCKEFIEFHGGTIEVESEEGVFTRFKFFLPIAYH